ncbi:COP23 domain-containing protein [Laspinema olomoucense]|uniref:COP23 domain-containing protein n=1 Tax=Laspinema olomoucense D3b TaxID=2953688 RepID=A0ABT2NAZ9_9CYAN|nr:MULTISPECIES: COP23 domain-containing protein [unclassified Laspinema]MCT7971840.1 COP23 domain-containing protein [Laspinema sp. D3d]MCT7979742.1 COP23 domain-containing protein [Laspinema sp. D3b]MCT7991785.1 COP23 domain-containing protein [Laspinema sp. D3a]MCT7993444.1 COP23 domain-containing protein [Laspinema sp. D3c]
MSLKKMGRWVAALLLATPGSLLLSPSSIASSPNNSVVSFECQSSESFYAIRAVRTDGSVSESMISWRNQGYQSSDDSLATCQQVSNQLNAVLHNNGNSLSGLYLTVGRVNGEMVVCAVNGTDIGCNRENVLFSFNGNNRAEPARLLAGLLGTDSLINLVVVGNLLQDFSPLPTLILTG